MAAVEPAAAAVTTMAVAAAMKEAAARGAGALAAWGAQAAAAAAAASGRPREGSGGRITRRPRAPPTTGRRRGVECKLNYTYDGYLCGKHSSRKKVVYRKNPKAEGQSHPPPARTQPRPQPQRSGKGGGDHPTPAARRGAGHGHATKHATRHGKAPAGTDTVQQWAEDARPTTSRGGSVRKATIARHPREPHTATAAWATAQGGPRHDRPPLDPTRPR